MSAAKSGFPVTADEVLRFSMIALGGACAAGLFVFAIFATINEMTVATALENARAGHEVMVCTAGTVVYDEDFDFTRLFPESHFHCTNWRMRDALDAETAKAVELRTAAPQD